MHKKIISGVFAATICVFLVGCAADTNTKSDFEKEVPGMMETSIPIEIPNESAVVSEQTNLSTDEKTSSTTCAIPEVLEIDNQALISFGMPDFPGGAHIKFMHDEAKNLVEASIMLGFETGPSFISYFLEQGDLKTVHFFADAYVPNFSEEGEFLGLDTSTTVPIQETIFSVAADGTVNVNPIITPTMEELMIILNPPTEPYLDWIESSFTGTYEFFELWQQKNCPIES